MTTIREDENHVAEAFEQSVIGGLIKRTEKIPDCNLAPEHFHFKENKIILKAILELDKEGKPVDALEISEKLDKEGLLEEVGGMAHISRLVMDTCSDSSLVSHAKSIKNRGILRQLREVCLDIADSSKKADSAEEALDKAQARILELGLQGDTSAPKKASEYLPAIYQELQRRQEANGELLGLSTGLSAVDDALNGLCPGKLYVVAGRPAMGKSVIGLQWSTHAVLNNKAVLYVSLEMPQQELLFRAIASIARINLDKIISAKLGPEEWHWTRDVMRQLHRSPLYIDESPGLTLSSLRFRARTLKKKADLKLIVVDYLTLMGTGDVGSGKAREDSRTREIGAISRGLKALAKELDIPIVLLAQLNRGVEQRVDRRPVMSDLRDSGEIEQDADVVICLYRDEVYDANSPDVGCMEFLIRKNRSGPIKMVPLAFMGSQVKVASLEGGLPSWQLPEPVRKPSRGFQYASN